jgi:arylsulfatase A-like enzyme
MGGTSRAVSMPSRAMLMTGRYLFSLERDGQSIPREPTMMGEAFSNSGYQTLGTGKWHNGQQAFNRCFGDGREIFFGGMADHWNVPVYDYDLAGEYAARIPYTVSFETQKVAYHNADHITNGKHSSELFSDQAIEFINRYDVQNPFFMYVSYMAPHDPRVMPQKYMDMYDTAKIALPANFMTEHPFDNGEMRVRDEVLLGLPRNQAEVKNEILRYYAMITHLDEQIGRVIEALKIKGLYENTIIVFAADNGLAVGQHGLLGKQNLYEHSLKVPLVFVGKGFDAGKKEERFTYLQDIFPTLCELTKTPIPMSVESQSVFSHKKREVMYYAYRHLQRAVRKENFKLIEYHVNGVETIQLFDLKDDPMEINNLANDPKYSKKVDEMKKLLREQKKLYNDKNS